MALNMDGVNWLLATRRSSISNGSKAEVDSICLRSSFLFDVPCDERTRVRIRQPIAERNNVPKLSRNKSPAVFLDFFAEVVVVSFLDNNCEELLCREDGLVRILCREDGLVRINIFLASLRERTAVLAN